MPVELNGMITGDSGGSVEDTSLHNGDSGVIAWFYPTGHQAHYETNHPERPERVETIHQALKRAGFWKQTSNLSPMTIERNLLESIHTPRYLTTLEMTSRRGGRLDADTYLTTASWQLALQAAGGAVAVADAVWQRKARRGFALTRPPGHHARPGQGMGFCLLNNVAIASQYILQAYGAKKLAIVDLDLHHGNGTQEIFWDRADVFYISTHQVPLYPGTGSLDDTGRGAGAGFTANFPLPPGSGDQAFLAIMEQGILPLLARYQPEMLLVSYGFDPHWSDPLGHLLLSASVYGRLIADLSAYADAYCQGRISLFLEGGYHLEAAEACSLAVTASLIGHEIDDPLGPSPYKETEIWRPILARICRLWGLPENK